MDTYLIELTDRCAPPTHPLDPDRALEPIRRTLRREVGLVAIEDEAREGDEEERPGRRERVSGWREAFARSAPREGAGSARMVVLGGPGLGKSTLLRQVMAEAVGRYRADEGAPLPVWVELPEFARARRSLEAFLGAEVWAEVVAGRALVCLDSLDEVPPYQRPDVIAQLNRWPGAYGGGWIVGSRLTEYKGGQMARGEYTEWRLEPLDREEQEALAERLLGSRERGRRFVWRLRDHPQASGWAENPHLMGLAAAAWREAEALPVSRARLYGRALAQITGRDPDPEGLRAELAELALELHQGQGRSFERGALEGRDAGRLLGSGLFDVVAPGVWRFQHQSLQEVLAARALATRLVGPGWEEAWDLAWSRRTFSRWTEVLRLMVGVLVQECGAAGQARALRWCEALLRQREQPGGDPGDLGLALALRSVAEIGDAPGRWPEEEAAALGRWVEAWIEEVLGEVGGLEHTGRRQRLGELSRELGRLNLPLSAGAEARLREAMESPDHALQDAAVALLCRLGRLAPAALFEQALALRSSTQTSSVLYTIRDAGVAVSPEALLGLMTKEHGEYVREAAASALGAQEEAPLEAILKMARARAVWRRRLGVAALRAMGGRAPVEALTRLLDDRSFRVRDDALQALVAMGERALAAGLEAELLKRATRVPEDVHGVSGAILSLWPMLHQEAFVEALLFGIQLEEKDGVVRSCAECLRAMGERTPVEALVTLLEAEGTAPRALGVVEQVLRGAPEGLLEPWRGRLLAVAERGGEGAQAVAVSVLASMGEEARSTARFLEGRASESAEVRRASFEALARLGREEALEGLVDASSGVVTATALAICEGDFEPFPGEALGRVVANTSMYEIDAVLHAIADRGQRLGVEVIEALLPFCWYAEGQDALVCADRATDALSRCVAPDLLLRLMLEPGGVEAPQAIAEVTERDEDDGYEVDGYEDWPPPDIRSYAADVLGRALARGVGREVVPSLVRALEVPKLKEYADAALYQLGAEAPEEQLLGQLEEQLRLSSLQEEAAALDVLGAVGVAEASRVASRIGDARHTDIRVAAARALRAMGAEAPLEVLVAALGDAVYEVREEAGRALGAFGDDCPVEALVGLLGVGEEYRKHDACVAEALTESGAAVDPEALMPAMTDYRISDAMEELLLRMPGAGEVLERTLLRWLEDHDPNHYNAARGYAVKNIARQLGRRGEGVEALLKAWGGIYDHDALCAIGEALARLGGAAPLEAVMAMVGSSESIRRRTGLIALGGQPDVDEEGFDALWLEALASPAWDVRAAAAQGLAHRARVGAWPLRGAVRDALLGAARDGGAWNASDVRVPAIEALGALDDPDGAIEAMLLEQLGDASNLVRAAAAGALAARLSEPRALAAVVAALGDRDFKVRQEALDALEAVVDAQEGIVDAPEAVAPARLAEASLRVVERLDAVMERQDGWTQGAQALALRVRIQPEEAEAALVRGMSRLHNALLARRAVELACARGLCGEAILDGLCDALTAPVGEVRSAAARALAVLAPDRLEGARRGAVAILEGGEPGEPLGAMRARHRVEALGRLPRQLAGHKQELSEALEHPHWRVRLAAAGAFGAMRRSIPNRALSRLLEMRLRDPAPVLREAVDGVLAEVLSLETAVEDVWEPPAA